MFKVAILQARSAYRAYEENTETTADAAKYPFIREGQI